MREEAVGCVIHREQDLRAVDRPQRVVLSESARRLEQRLGLVPGLAAVLGVAVQAQKHKGVQFESTVIFFHNQNLKPGGLKPGGLKSGGLKPGGLKPGGLKPDGFETGWF